MYWYVGIQALLPSLSPPPPAPPIPPTHLPAENQLISVRVIVKAVSNYFKGN